MAYVPKGRTFDQFTEGEVIETCGRTITEADVVAFAALSGDWNPLHTDAVWAAGTPFKERIAHGMLVASVATGLANSSGVFEGTTIALLTMTNKWTGPVKFGDTIHMEMKVGAKKETGKPDRGIINFLKTVKNQRGETVMEGEWLVMMKRAKSA